MRNSSIKAKVGDIKRDIVVAEDGKERRERTKENENHSLGAELS